MKKAIVFVLMIVLLSASVFAGGKQAASSGSGAASGSGATQVDVFWYTFADTYLTSVRNAMAAEFSLSDQFTVRHHDCNNDQAKQTQMVQTAITQGTKLVIVNIATTGSEEAAMNIVNLAKGANVPIVFFNREVSNNVIKSYANAAFVGTDANEAGYMQGEGIAKFLLKPENWNGNRSRFDLNGDGNINYVMFRGEHGNAEALGRTKFSVQEANKLLAGKLKLTSSPANATSTQYENDGISNYWIIASSSWSAADGANAMRTALSAHNLTGGAIEIVIANNDDMALGSIEAMNELGFNTGRDETKYIPVFGVDATAVAQEAIRSGKMTSSVLQDAVGMAKTIFALAKNVAAGQHVFANTSSFNVDSGVNKIRVPYALFE